MISLHTYSLTGTTSPGRGATRRRRALVYVETIISITLSLVVVGLLAAALVQYAGVRRVADVRRELLLAAESELDAIRAGLRAAPADATTERATRQAGTIVLHTTSRPGAGAWDGLTEVRVVARKQTRGEHLVQVELTTYLARRFAP